jgi:hypothetical protein
VDARHLRRRQLGQRVEVHRRRRAQRRRQALAVRRRAGVREAEAQQPAPAERLRHDVERREPDDGRAGGDRRVRRGRPGGPGVQRGLDVVLREEQRAGVERVQLDQAQPDLGDHAEPVLAAAQCPEEVRFWSADASTSSPAPVTTVKPST